MRLAKELNKFNFSKYFGTEKHQAYEKFIH